MTGPIVVIKPLPALWLGLGGNDFFCLSPTGMTGPFLRGWSSFPSFFLFDDPFLTTLGADIDAPSFSFLHAAADALTRALCLAASVSVKGKRRTLSKQTERSGRKE